jgi:hypothetical protein
VPCRILPFASLELTFLFYSFELSGPFDEHQEQNARLRARSAKVATGFAPDRAPKEKGRMILPDHAPLRAFLY